MAANEHIKQQEIAGQEQAQKSAIKETEALCKHCGSALEPDLPFCTSCGEKVSGEELLCQFCQTKTSMDFCPHCGRRINPLNCGNCHTPSVYDACENCGVILNSSLERTLHETNAKPAEMGLEESEKIEAELYAIDESAEFKAFQKKLIERQILLEERDYFNKREKRIIKTFGSNPFTLELPDPAEEAFRMKAYSALEKTVIERENKAIEAELERLFPPRPAIDTDTSVEDAKLAELERNRAEMERRFNEALVNVNNEVETFRIEEERKRLEEERRRLEAERRRKEEEAERQRQIEIERRRLEEERRRNRTNGNYYHSSHSGMLSASLRINGNRADCSYRCTVCGRATITYSVSINNDQVILSGGSKYGDYCTWREYMLVENYRGTVNDSGTVLNGYWYNNGESVPIVFYKR